MEKCATTPPAAAASAATHNYYAGGQTERGGGSDGPTPFVPFQPTLLSNRQQLTI